MGAIAEIFRQFGPEYLEKYQQNIPTNHKKVIEAIIRCRTKACGTNIFGCAKCNRSVAVFRSCGNRHCPQPDRIIKPGSSWKNSLIGSCRVTTSW